jgi:hypothetical protein
MAIRLAVATSRRPALRKQDPVGRPIAHRTTLVWVLPHTGHVVVDQVVTVKPKCGLS